MRFLTSLLTCTALSVVSVVNAAAGECYYPDGSVADNYEYTACGNETTTFSQCCIAENDECLPNGMCSYTGKYDYRAACDNEDWDNCPNPCPNIWKTSWVQVKECATNEYCCNSDFDNGDCCKDGSKRFDMDAPDPNFEEDEDSQNGDDDEETSTTTTNTGENFGPTTPPSPPDPPAPGSDEASEGEDSGGLSGGAIGAIGGSIGGAAVLGLSVLTWWLLKRRRQKGESAELHGDEVVKTENEKSHWGGNYYPGPPANGGSPPMEMEGSLAPVEMLGDTTPVESGGRELPPRKETYEMGG